MSLEIDQLAAIDVHVHADSALQGGWYRSGAAAYASEDGYLYLRQVS